MIMLPSGNLLIFDRGFESMDATDTSPRAAVIKDPQNPNWIAPPFPDLTSHPQLTNNDYTRWVPLELPGGEDCDLFCTGHILLPDGRLLLAGGNIWSNGLANRGDDNLLLFSENSATPWTKIGDMLQTRWYPTVVQVPDGRLLVISGTMDPYIRNESIESVRVFGNGEISISNIPPQITPFNYNHIFYPFWCMMPYSNNEVFVAGPRGDTYKYDLTTNRYSSLWPLQSQGTSWTVQATYPSMAQIDSKIVKCGGRGSLNAVNSSAFIDLANSTPQWSQTAPMNIARCNHHLIPLPDKTVLALDGNYTENVIFQPGMPERTPEIFTLPRTTNPSGTWTSFPNAMATMGRGYHCTALLLPSGDVVLSGGDVPSNTTINPTLGRAQTMNDMMVAEYFRPPYQSISPKPVVTTFPTVLRRGSSFALEIDSVPTPIESVVCISLGSSTHAYDFTQRLVTMPIVSQTRTGDHSRVVAAVPSNPSQMLDGYYMLFARAQSGAMSIAKIVQVKDTHLPMSPAYYNVAGGVNLSGGRKDLLQSDGSPTSDANRMVITNDGSDTRDATVTIRYYLPRANRNLSSAKLRYKADIQVGPLQPAIYIRNQVTQALQLLTSTYPLTTYSSEFAMETPISSSNLAQCCGQVDGKVEIVLIYPLTAHNKLRIDELILKTLNP